MGQSFRKLECLCLFACKWDSRRGGNDDSVTYRCQESESIDVIFSSHKIRGFGMNLGTFRKKKKHQSNIGLSYSHTL